MKVQRIIRIANWLIRPNTRHQMRLAKALRPDGPTDGRTDGRTDIPSYRDATAHLKKSNVIVTEYLSHCKVSLGDNLSYTISNCEENVTIREK